MHVDVNPLQSVKLLLHEKSAYFELMFNQGNVRILVDDVTAMRLVEEIKKQFEHFYLNETSPP